MILPRTLYVGWLALALLITDPSAARVPGDLDPAFGSDGVVVTSAAIAANGASVVLRQPDGKLGRAPNHRYTTSLATLNTMLGQGWFFEGDATTKVFACVPQ
jgi:hypothetical protein